MAGHQDGTTAGGSVAAGDAAAAITPAQRQAVGGALTKLISASVGDLCVVFSKSPAHKHFSLADIEWKVLPAVLLGQFYVAEAMHKDTGARAPLAVVTWARVSAETDARLRSAPGQPIRLRPDEWAAGPHHWLVDVAGEPRAIAGALKALIEGPLKDQPVTIATTDAAGRPVFATLSDLMAAAKISTPEGAA